MRAFWKSFGLLPVAALAMSAEPASFDDAVGSFLKESCVVCHSEGLASGGLNLAAFQDAASLASHRDEWETVVRRVRAGDMPPKGLPRPESEVIDRFLGFVLGEFERADASVKPDPGRVTARRLNRAEYSNTIRDLLGIEFRAEKDFPTDDSGHGFDNIADVLTISPVLMEKYIDAAERISASALGANPLPAKPLEEEYHAKDKRIQRIDDSTIEASHRVEWDAEYLIRIGLPGERAKDAEPVEMRFWMDGKPLHTMLVETKPSGLVYFNPYSVEEFRLYLPAGDHVFRVGFVGDTFVETLSEKDRYDREKNKYIESIGFVGPFPSDREPPSRQRILTCDPKTGEACVREIVSKLARRAYRRPVGADDVEPLMRFVRMAADEGESLEQGIQLALQAMLVSPHFLFRIERDPDSAEPGAVRQLSDIELASRLSYFLWSSMPDEELLSLAEKGKLGEPDVLATQVDRMLADERASALAENFAGQWLETRNLDHVNPDPDLFPQWGPELRDAMKTETRLFFEALLRENRPATEFLSARFTYLNGRLARHYGIEGVTGPEFRRVELEGANRAGVLGHASVLTVTSYPTRTSPVIRGKYVLENILGAPPPPPPADVPALDAAGVGSSGSLRQKLEQHRSSAVCASCHDRMDTLGFGLENFDAIGRYRTHDGDFEIDSSGEMPSGERFATPVEMAGVLEGQSSEFVRCLTEKLLTYSLGRGLERADRRTVDSIVTRAAESENRFQTLIRAIVESMPFQMRRGEAMSTTAGASTEELARK